LAPVEMPAVLPPVVMLGRSAAGGDARPICCRVAMPGSTAAGGDARPICAWVEMRGSSAAGRDWRLAALAPVEHRSATVF
jgi:hypothetical protein